MLAGECSQARDEWGEDLGGFSHGPPLNFPYPFQHTGARVFPELTTRV